MFNPWSGVDLGIRYWGQVAPAPPLKWQNQKENNIMDIVPTSNEILAPPLTLDYEHVLCPSLSDLKLEDTMHNP